MEMEKKKWAGWVVLTVVVLVAAVVLAATNLFTKKSIADQNLAQAQEALLAIFPEADPGEKGFEPMELSEDSGLAFAYTVKKDGNVIGYAGASQVKGYGGLIEVTVGVEPSGVIRGIGVGGAGFKETEGLGSKVKEDAFRQQFVGKETPLSLNGEIDVISGATVTSQAVVDGVNETAESLWFAVGLVPNQGVTQPPAKAGRRVNASIIGYGGPVLVQLEVNDAGEIVAITVGRERFKETEGIGSKVKEETFTSQFIGKTPPLTLSDIDAVSGATVSSQAVVDAVNTAYDFLKQSPER